MRRFVLILLVLSAMCIKNSPIQQSVIIPQEVSAKINEMNELMLEIDSRVYGQTEFAEMESALADLEGLEGKYSGIFGTLFGKDNVTIEYLHYCEDWRKLQKIEAFRSLTARVPNQTAVLVSSPMSGMPFHNYSSYISTMEKYEEYMSALLEPDMSEIGRLTYGIGLILELMDDGVRVGMDLWAENFLSENYSENIIGLFTYPPYLLNETIETMLTSDIKKLSEDLELLLPELNGSVKNEMQQYLYDLENCDVLTCSSKMRDIHFMLASASEIFDSWLKELRKEYNEQFGIVRALNSEFRGEVNPLLGS